LKQEGIQKFGSDLHLHSPREYHSLRFEFGDGPRLGTTYPTHHHEPVRTENRPTGGEREAWNGVLGMGGAWRPAHGFAAGLTSAYLPSAVRG